MNEIEFRGKRIDVGEWVYGNLCLNILGNLGIQEIVGSHKFKLFREITPETVGQYIGLKDKNRVKIYVGDIVKFGLNTYQIIFECGGFCLLDKDGDMIKKIGGINDHCYSIFDLFLECCWENDSAYDIEIIGNIHDNLNLMGVRE